MLSKLILGFCLWIPSHTYAALLQFHATSSVAHTSSDLSEANAPAGAVSAITWSPGTMTMTERMTEGAQAERTQDELTHDALLVDFDQDVHTGQVPNMATLRRLLRQSTEISPSPGQGQTDLHAPNLVGMRRYSSEELYHIEQKAKQMKNGFDYTYLPDGKFLRNQKTMWDVHGFGGRIRVYDYEDHELLYQTDCCYCKGQKRDWDDLTTGEAWLEIAAYGCGGIACGALTFAVKMMCGL
ncbi:uncharacterized protein MELLADRAFT_95503 [Melampsora larici-populina 98AG31]|uniref:Secreted protein n=1 Tax=Melampsora larici-populina (strain 98AG31 / pathotype 3-4-7) TaxID=747676 RepID=F4S9K8_MELLP|nr:uncharacterized protein MELLADRAFT_95503 [Melampsora larici-populina 98AG31]EGF98683.1 secreted protein [Melampsora larici-populina 98AG31]